MGLRRFAVFGAQDETGVCDEQNGHCRNEDDSFRTSSDFMINQRGSSGQNIEGEMEDEELGMRPAGRDEETLVKMLTMGDKKILAAVDAPDQCVDYVVYEHAE